MSRMILIVLFLSSQQVFGVSFLQEEKEILCEASQASVVVEKKDRYFLVNEKKYRLVEFLDSAILARAENNEFALLQLMPKSKALLIEGMLVNYKESDCRQINANKSCENEFGKIGWSPTWLETSNIKHPVIQYGVYPNDGTYFLAKTGDQGVALVDFGSKFIVVSGEAKELSCQYRP